MSNFLADLFSKIKLQPNKAVKEVQLEFPAQQKSAVDAIVSSLHSELDSEGLRDFVEADDKVKIRNNIYQYMHRFSDNPEKFDKQLDFIKSAIFLCKKTSQIVIQTLDELLRKDTNKLIKQIGAEAPKFLRQQITAELRKCHQNARSHSLAVNYCLLGSVKLEEFYNFIDTDEFKDIITSVVETPSEKRVLLKKIERLTHSFRLKEAKSHEIDEEYVPYSPPVRTTVAVEPFARDDNAVTETIRAEIARLKAVVINKDKELGSDTAQYRQMLEKTNNQADVVTEQADKAKAEHKELRTRLQEKISSLVEAYPPLADHELIKATLEAINKRSKITAPAVNVSKDTAARQITDEIDRLKKSAPAKAMPLFKEINRLVTALQEKTEQHFIAKKALAEAESQNARQQKREERYKAHKTYAETLEAKIETAFSNEGLQRIFNAHSGKAYPALSLFREWYNANPDIQERVIITENALKTVENSSYAKPELVYEAVELLANEFFAQKKSGTLEETERSAARKAFIDKCEELRLSIGGSITTTSKKLLEKYSVAVNGDKVFLDQHLQKGNSWEERFCLRVYFTWSDKHDRVVIGHMPSHLPTLKQ